MGGGFLKRDAGNGIAAGCAGADGELVDFGGARAVGIGDADVDGVAGFGDRGDVAFVVEVGLACGDACFGSGFAVRTFADFRHDEFHVCGALLGLGEELAGGGHEQGVGGDGDRAAAFFVDVVHLLAEALGVGVEDLVIADDLEGIVAGVRCAEGGGDLAAELGFLITELAEEKGFLIAGGGPNDDLDLGARAGDGESGIGEGDFQTLAGDEVCLAGGGAEFDFGGLHEFLALELDFP